jgi:hypothetical protein
VNPVLILDLPVLPGPNHNGGTILFGPDDKLYVVIGDLNHNGQLQNNPTGPAPDDSGVILRLNDDGSVPADNPFAAQGGNLAKYFGYGIRNSFGMAFDSLTNRLWVTENGPGSYDEINLVEPGFNGGWRPILGPDSRDPQGVGDLFMVPGAVYRDPKFSWFVPVAPTGIAFLDSTALGDQYENNAFVGDFNNGQLYRFRPNPARDGFVFTAPGLADLVADNAAELDELIFGTGFGGITDVKVGPDGHLYVLSIGAGKIFAISRASGPPPSISLAFAGLARDRVGPGPNNLVPDGALDGTFTVTLAADGGDRTVNRVELRHSNGVSVWDTDPATSFWGLGAAASLDAPLLNVADGSVNFLLPAGSSVLLFAADPNNTRFTAGARLTVTLTFSDDSSASDDTVIGP